jgi:hypothetical protein
VSGCSEGNKILIFLLVPFLFCFRFCLEKLTKFSSEFIVFTRSQPVTLLCFPRKEDFTRRKEEEEDLTSGTAFMELKRVFPLGYVLALK